MPRARLALPLALGALAAPASALGASGFGGPDGAGYVYRDSTETAGGPVFSWVGSGALVPQTLGNDSHLPATLPFTFPFYGQTYSTVEVHSNGYLQFGADAARAAPTGLPSSGQTPAIYGWWLDWNPETAASPPVKWGANGSDFVVTWDNVQANGGTGYYQFQVVLRADGSMLFQYNVVSASDLADLGAGATIGIEQGAGGSALEYYGGDGPGPLASGLAIEFRPCHGEDLDSDGFSECAGDCQDSRADVNPTATDDYGNGDDENCDGADGVNAGGDDDTAPGGDDDTAGGGCTEAEDICDDGVDNDCDGHVDGYDGECVQGCGWTAPEDPGEPVEGQASQAWLPLGALAFGLLRRPRRGR